MASRAGSLADSRWQLTGRECREETDYIEGGRSFTVSERVAKLQISFKEIQ
jgi:hypothetical protein